MIKQSKRVEPDDQLISQLVRGVKYSIPAELDNQISEIILQNRKKKPMLWLRLSLSAVAIAIITAVFVMLIPYFHVIKPSEPEMQISEIKTQFELSDKNIKILWVQKKDFNLLRRQE